MSDANRPAAAAELSPEMAALRAGLEQSALQRLGATNWFPPFALAMRPDGGIIDYSASIPAEQATPEMVHKVLVAGLGKGAREGRFRAVGLCHGIVMKDSGRHALRIVLEQPGGVAREVIAPYLKQADGKFTLEPATVTATTSVIFFDDSI
jgi:hypothetical protein